MFVLIARLCRRRSVEQVRAMMPPPETVEAAVQRVKQAVRFLYRAFESDLSVGWQLPMVHAARSFELREQSHPRVAQPVCMHNTCHTNVGRLSPQAQVCGALEEVAELASVGCRARRPSLTLCLTRMQITGDVGGDDDFVATSAVVSLRDPLSGSRIVTPARCVNAVVFAGRCCELVLCLGIYVTDSVELYAYQVFRARAVACKRQKGCGQEGLLLQRAAYSHSR